MEKEVVWIDGRDPRLGLCGCAGGEAYCRFSAEEREALKKVNPDEAYLSTNPAGVMLRFFTDSSIVAVRGKVERPSDMTHMPAIPASAGMPFAATCVLRRAASISKGSFLLSRKAREKAASYISPSITEWKGWKSVCRRAASARRKSSKGERSPFTARPSRKAAA